MKYCPKCGNPCRDHDMYCIKCGYDFRKREQESKNEPKLKKIAIKPVKNRYRNPRPNAHYKKCDICHRSIYDQDETCPYCGAKQTNYFYANYCSHCGKRVHNFKKSGNTPDVDGDTNYYVCPYCGYKQGWHCPDCHRYNDLKWWGNDRPLDRTGNGDDLTCFYCNNVIGRRRCKKCGTPMASTFDYCPHCGATRSTVYNPAFRLACTKHPYVLLSSTIGVAFIGLIDNLLSGEFSSTSLTSQFFWDILFVILLSVVMAFTGHHCPITMILLTMGITYGIIDLTVGPITNADTPVALSAISFVYVPLLVITSRICSVGFMGQMYIWRGIAQYVFNPY